MNVRESSVHRLVDEQGHGNLFQGLRVIDFTGELGPYAGRLYAGLGADVVHLEPIRGDPLRQRGPFLHNIPGPERSLPFLYYNAGKRGIVLDLDKPKGREIFLMLCSGADLLLESTAPGYLDARGVGYEALCRSNPRLVHTAITPFGSWGPYKDWPGSDLTCSAWSGFLFLAGIGDAKPVRTCDDQTYRMAEAYAAVGSAAALFHARRTGKGQFVDVCCMEASVTALEKAVEVYDLEGRIRRGRGLEAANGSIHPCKDGYVALVAVMGNNKSMWQAFVKWMKSEAVEGCEAFEDEKWLDPSYRSSPQGRDQFSCVFEPYARMHDKMYLYHTGQSFKVAITPVCNGKDLLENPQLAHRHFWHKLWHVGLGAEITSPGPPFRFGTLRWHIGRPAPTFGQHSAEVLEEIGYSRREVEELVCDGVTIVGSRM